MSSFGRSLPAQYAAYNLDVPDWLLTRAALEKTSPR